MNVNVISCSQDLTLPYFTLHLSLPIFYQVLHHLEQQADPALPINYLEYLINDVRIQEVDAVFHNALIKLYLGRVRHLYADYLQTLPPGMTGWLGSYI